MGVTCRMVNSQLQKLYVFDIWRHKGQRISKKEKRLEQRKKRRPMKEKKTNEAEATFVVRIKQRPGDTWRGDVSWVSGSGKQKFENMQELFSLMNDSLQMASLQSNGID